MGYVSLGNTKLRRLLVKESKWTDKEAPKHKHNFCEPVIVEVQKPFYSLYYKALKCNRCYSFRNAKCCKEATEPTIRLKSSHSMIGFKDAVLIKEER